MNPSPPSRGVVGHVAKSELLRLVRDRKAVFFALVLPLLLYPVLFLGANELEEVSEQRMEEQRVSIGADLTSLSDELRTRLRERLPEPDGEIVLWAQLGQAPGSDGVGGGRESGDGEVGGEPASGALDPQPADTPAQPFDLEALTAAAQDGELGAYLREHGPHLLDGGDYDVVVLGIATEPPTIAAVHRRDNESGMRAASLVADAARGLATRIFDERLVALVGSDPAEGFEAAARDLARTEDTAGLALGKLLPLIAILVVISGGAFAALEAFAAEREVGTLETILVQPVPRIEIARGKLVAIVATALVAWTGNAASLLACASLGLLAGVDEGLAEVSALALAGRVTLGTLLLLPTVAFVSAVLGVVSARARSYREGQNYILPVTLAGMALTAPAAAGDVVLDPVLALVPILGPSLAMRDVVAGSLAPLPALLAFASSVAYALVALRGIAGTLDAERLLQGADVDAEAAARRVHARRALYWGSAGTIAIVLVGGWLQSRDLVWGLIATLWGLALGLGLVAGRDLGRRLGEPLTRVLGLGGPIPIAATVGAFLAGPGLSKLALELLEVQQRFLPMPNVDLSAMEEVFGALLDQPLWFSLFLVAVTPAICEEVLFRGAVLRGLHRDLPLAKSIGWQALLFGLAHASIYRLLPTATLGALLGLIRIRSGSLLPCIALHFSYNGTGVLSASAASSSGGDGASELLWLGHPIWYGVAIIGLAFALRPARSAD